MTPEQLTGLVEGKNFDAIVAAMSGLDECIAGPSCRRPKSFSADIAGTPRRDFDTFGLL